MNEDDTFDRLKYRIEVTPNGTRRYYNSDGVLHRDEGPAVVFKDGSEQWYVNGLRHRVDGPAVIWVGSASLWYVHGNLHRTESNEHE